MTGIAPAERSEYLSGDFGLCQLWRKLGGKAWLDVECALAHTGSHDFVGDPALRQSSSDVMTLKAA